MVDELLKKIANNFTELNERERKLMKDRFDIDMPRMPTLEQVQAAFEKTRARLREIEERALRKTPRKPPGGNDGGGSPPGDSPTPNS